MDTATRIYQATITSCYILFTVIATSLVSPNTPIAGAQETGQQQENLNNHHLHGSTTTESASTTEVRSLALGSDATPPLGPSETGWSVLDFFTGGGAYMPRTHCIIHFDHSTDWPWVIALVALSAGVVIWYVRIFVFWMRAYLRSKNEIEVKNYSI